MPWSESRVEDRLKFMSEYATGRWSLEELSRRYGISRKTAYKVIHRFLEEGVEGLHDRSRARHTQEHRTPEHVERRLVEAARQFGCWGPRKLVAVLRRRHPEVSWPAKSTVGDILKRHGLVKPRRSRRRVVKVPPSSLAPAREPNDLWCTDFKGWCLSGDRQRCEPFVLGDGFSRYALKCTLVGSVETAVVWPIFEEAFREYGLPRRIRSDNGPPFASPGLAGLSRLSVRWLRLGIRPERIKPGKPQENGALERFNLTLGIEAMRPPAPTQRGQQRACDRFRVRYNEVRPHEALGDKTPAEVYVPSPRLYPGEIPEFQYKANLALRRVRRRGVVKWAGSNIFLSETIVGEIIGFEQISSRHWSVRLGPLEIAIFDDEARDILRHDRLVWAEENDE